MTKIHRKTVADCDRQVLRVTGALDQGTRALHRDLQRQLGRDGWDVSEECLQELTESLALVLRARHARLVQAVCERQQVASYGREVRHRRDLAAREVYDHLVDLRRIVHGMAGSQAVRATFGRGKTPRRPREVFSLARSLRRRLKEPAARQKLCGRIGSEEVLLRWLEQVEEPLRRLAFFLLEVRKMEIAERRTVPSVQMAKSEMEETQQLAFALVDSLFGLAGVEEVRRALQPPALQESDRSRGDVAEPSDAPTASTADQPLASAERTELPPWQTTEGAVETTDLRGTAPSAENDRIELPGRGRFVAHDLAETVSGAQRPEGGTDPPVDGDTDSSDAASPKVWNVLGFLKTIPHRVRNGRDPDEIESSEETAA